MRPGGIELRERREQLGEILSLNADARVRDADRVAFARRASAGARLDRDAALVRKFARVPHQVEQTLADPETVAVKVYRLA